MEPTEIRQLRAQMHQDDGDCRSVTREQKRLQQDIARYQKQVIVESR